MQYSTVSTTVISELNYSIDKHLITCRYIVKYDLVTSTKSTQLPAAFANVTGIQSSVDSGKLVAYHLYNSNAIDCCGHVNHIR